MASARISGGVTTKTPAFLETRLWRVLKNEEGIVKLLNG
jgi:hypothetical protein